MILLIELPYLRLLVVVDTQGIRMSEESIPKKNAAIAALI